MLRGWKVDSCLRAGVKVRTLSGCSIPTSSTKSNGQFRQIHQHLPRASFLLLRSSNTKATTGNNSHAHAYANAQLRYLRQMTTPELRKEFTEFFVKEYGHTSVKSASLIPHNDKSLMFTNAGTGFTLEAIKDFSY